MAGRAEWGAGREPRAGWGPWVGKHQSPGDQGTARGLVPTWAGTRTWSAGRGQCVPCPRCSTEGAQRPGWKASWKGRYGRGALGGQALGLRPLYLRTLPKGARLGLEFTCPQRRAEGPPALLQARHPAAQGRSLWRQPPVQGASVRVHILPRPGSPSLGGGAAIGSSGYPWLAARTACSQRSMHAGMSFRVCFPHGHIGCRVIASSFNAGRSPLSCPLSLPSWRGPDVPALWGPPQPRAPRPAPFAGRMTSVLRSFFQVAGAAEPRSRTASPWWPWTNTGTWAVSSAGPAANS